MNLHLSEDERLLRDAATRFLARRHPPARAREACRRGDAERMALWRETAEQGWPALLAPEALGGLGLGMRAAWVVMEAAGRHLYSLPLAANMAVLPTLCADGAGEAAHWLGDVVAGRACYAWAVARPDGALYVEGAGLPALALRELGGGRLRLERYAPCAGGGGLDPTLPVARQAGAEPEACIEIGAGGAACERLRARLWLLRSAELVGAASAALDLAAAHARERLQFGRPIGACQAVKHRLAEDWMALDDARLAGLAAAASHDEGLPRAGRDALFAPLLAVEAARRAAQRAIQVHGALGITWECDAHLYLKRVLRVAAAQEADMPTAELLERIWETAAPARAA